MTRRAVALALSVLLHAAVAGTLALMAPPAAPEAELETSLVTLKLSTPPPEASLGGVSSTSSSPAAQTARPATPQPRATAAPRTASPTPPPARPQPSAAASPAAAAPQASQAPAPTPAATEPRSSSPREVSSAALPSASAPPAATRELPPAPTIGELQSEGPVRPPAVDSRISAAPSAPAAPDSVSRIEPEPGDLQRLGAAAGGARPSVPSTLKAPAIQPDPLSLLSEIRTAAQPPENRGGASPQAADTVAGARIETVVEVPGRSPTTSLGIAFPEALRREGRDADVTARIRVDRRGTVVSVEILKTSGTPSVDVAVEQVLRSTLFAPSNGDTIDEGTVTYHFRLKGRF